MPCVATKDTDIITAPVVGAHVDVDVAGAVATQAVPVDATTEHSDAATGPGRSRPLTLRPT